MSYDNKLCVIYDVVCSGFLYDATLFDACFLAGELAQVVELGTAHFAVFVDCD